jgi:hypothetical protein
VPGTDVRSREGIKWYPVVRVEKYSPDQTQWALEHLDEMWRYERPVRTRSGLLVGPGILHGDWLREVFPGGPEDGVAVDEGNQMVNGGLTNLINLLTGAAASGAAGRPLTLGGGGGAAGSACVGVGVDGTTAFAVGQTHLANSVGEGAAASWYQSMDTGYPTLTVPATINGQSTFQAGVANFAWNEWCWISGAGVPTAGTTLAGVYATSGSGAMLNRKVPSGGLGSKSTGASWVFATTVTFS